MSTSGKFLTVKTGNVAAEVEDNNVWKCSENAKELDRTVGASLGFGDIDLGVQRATVTIHAFLDLATVTGGGYADLEAGNVITDLALYYNRGDATPAFLFPVAAVVDSDLGGEVDGQFEWNATVKNKGPYSYAVPAGA